MLEDPWKLVWRRRAGREPELYDLSRDPGELQDVATEYPKITERLATQFEDWQSQMQTAIQPASMNPKR